MQTQPRPFPSRTAEALTARQAATISDDAFRGGESAMRAAAPASLRSPWRLGARQLRETGRRDASPRAE